MNRQKYLDKAKQKIKDYFKDPEYHIVQEIKTIDLLDRVINELLEQLKEWQLSNWPEIQDKKDYLEILAEKGLRQKNIDSKGADLHSSFAQIFKQYAQTILSLKEQRAFLRKDLQKRVFEYCPNFAETAGEVIAARFLTHFPLRKLATLPSSTLQLIGAEKALFRHLKTGAKPPKYGYIFAHPSVRTGKDARQLANRISLAIRKDFFGGRAK